MSEKVSDAQLITFAECHRLKLCRSCPNDGICCELVVSMARELIAYRRADTAQADDYTYPGQRLGTGSMPTEPRPDPRYEDEAAPAQSDAETVRALEKAIREAVDDLSWAIECLDVRGQRGQRMTDCTEHLKNIRAALSRLSAGKEQR
jgi:hypothetical protein